MSAVNHDAGAGAGASLAARTVAAATAAAKQLGMVLGIAQQSPPPPPQGPPPPPSSFVTAPSVEGLQAVIEELVIAKDEKKGKDCEPEEERAAASNDRRSEPAEVKPENGKVEEEREKKAGKDKGSNGNPFPQRPGERDCTFFVRTGKCAYGQSCKFNHPPDRWKKNRAQRQGMPEPYQVSSANVVGEDKECRKVEKLKCKNFASPGGCKYGNASIYAHYVEKVEAEIELNFLGLPIRPGEKECTLYMEAGTCKDSTNCKYHHPNPTAFDGSDQPSEFSSSSTALLSDYGNASWVSQSTSYGLHPPPVDASFLHLQVMPAVNQVPPSNNDWHIYQASIDPCLINGVRQSLAVPASDVATKHHVDGKDYINATNDCKRNEDFLFVSTPAFMNEGKGGGNPSPVAATMAAGKAARSANHLPVSNANSATPKKGNGKHNPVGGMSDNNKGKRTGKMSTRPLLSVSPEATIGKKKERQPPSANPNNVTKNSGVDKLVSIPKYVPKEQGKEQPAVSGHNGNTEGMTSKNETISYHVPKGTEVGKKPQGDIQYDGANMKESEEQPINGKGNENNPTKISGNEIRPAKSKKNEKHSPVANAHYVPKEKTKEEQHHISTNHDDSGGKGKKPQGGIRYDGTNMKEYEEKTIKSKENESNPTKISGNESRPTKSKKSEKHSPVANAHYVPKGKSKEEQHPVSTHHDEFSGKGNGNHHAVATPIISVSAKKNIKHPPSHDFKNLNPCGKYSPVGVSASDAIINKYTTGKPSDDVILSDVAERTDSTKSKQPTQSTELRRRPGQRECPYYLKKGGCKYNSCKFDHPMDLNHIEISSNCVLSPKGLPLRPGIPVCTYYRQNGICKYGPVCKFDHPVNVITCDTVSK